ncbi:Calcium-binding protein 8 [Chelonia mydas]|uniref:Calcium-binding protein 8 n=1 Tax=Chelonia mydas TaxID=8469 RepID=M7BV47_CHEMY|nr:Calcium-binding protein 8 [Chelonia mydas]
MPFHHVTAGLLYKGNYLNRSLSAGSDSEQLANISVEELDGPGDVKVLPLPVEALSPPKDSGIPVRTPAARAFLHQRERLWHRGKAPAVGKDSSNSSLPEPFTATCSYTLQCGRSLFTAVYSYTRIFIRKSVVHLTEFPRVLCLLVGFTTERYIMALGKLKMISQHPCKQCTKIREAFRVLDRDGNGFISKQELGMAMRSLGYMPSEVELAIIMQRLDMDGDGQVDFDEFMTILGPKLVSSEGRDGFLGNTIDSIFWQCSVLPEDLLFIPPASKEEDQAPDAFSSGRGHSSSYYG